MATPTTIEPSFILAPPPHNHFELSDHANETSVTLDTGRSGPINPNGDNDGPNLQYRGWEGTFSFSGPEVATESTSLGDMYTVLLPDLGVWFTLLLPSVIASADVRPQPFHTIAIKSERHTDEHGRLTGEEASPTYAVIKMHGTAAEVAIPL